MVPWSSSAFNVPTRQCVKKQDDYNMNSWSCQWSMAHKNPARQEWGGLSTLTVESVLWLNHLCLSILVLTAERILPLSSTATYCLGIGGHPTLAQIL